MASSPQKPPEHAHLQEQECQMTQPLRPKKSDPSTMAFASPNVNIGQFIASPMLSGCVRYFVDKLSPFYPGFDRAWIETTLLHTTLWLPEACSALLALAALVLAQPGTAMIPRAYEGIGIPSRTTLDLSATLLRQASDMIGDVVHASDFAARLMVFCAASALHDGQRAAGIISGASFAPQRMQQCNENGRGQRMIQSSQNQLRWLAFVKERLYGIGHPYILKVDANAQLPEFGNSSSANWLAYMVALALPLEGILADFCDERGPSLLKVWETHAAVSEALVEPLVAANNHIVDLLCCQRWLQCRLWQLAGQVRPCEDISPHMPPVCDLTYPLKAVRDVVLILRKFDFGGEVANVPELVPRLCDILLAALDALFICDEPSPMEEDPGVAVRDLIHMTSSSDVGRRCSIPPLITKVKSLDFIARSMQCGASAWNAYRLQIWPLLKMQSTVLASQSILLSALVYYPPSDDVGRGNTGETKLQAQPDCNTCSTDDWAEEVSSST